MIRVPPENKRRKHRHDPVIKLAFRQVNITLILRLYIIRPKLPRLQQQLIPPPQGILKLAKVLRVKMDEWSRFCAEYGDFVYEVVNCKALGLSSDYDTVEKVLEDWKVVKK